MTELLSRTRRRSAAWPGVVGVLAVVGAAFLTSSLSEHAVRDESNGETFAPALLPPMLPATAPPTETLGDGDLFDVPALIPRIGLRVRVPAANVQSAPGDGLLWVGRSVTQRLLVVLPPGATRVAPGQTIGVTGTLRRMPTSLVAWRARFGIADAAVRALREARVYLQADSVAVRRP